MSESEIPTTRREATTIERHRLLVRSAAECFIEKGFHQTSMRDIARKAGVSLGNLYNHFEGKAGLIAEISSLETEDLSEFERDLGKDMSSVNKVERFAVAYFDYVSRLENAVLSAEITAEALRNPDIAHGFLRNKERVVNALAEALETGKERGEVAFSERPHDMALLILDLVESAGMRVAFGRRGERARTKKLIKNTVGRLIAV